MILARLFEQTRLRPHPRTRCASDPSQPSAAGQVHLALTQSSFGAMTTPAASSSGSRSQPSSPPRFERTKQAFFAVQVGPPVQADRVFGQCPNQIATRVEVVVERPGRAVFVDILRCPGRVVLTIRLRRRPFAARSDLPDDTRQQQGRQNRRDQTDVSRDRAVRQRVGSVGSRVRTAAAARAPNQISRCIRKANTAPTMRSAVSKIGSPADGTETAAQTSSTARSPVPPEGEVRRQPIRQRPQRPGLRRVFPDHLVNVARGTD